MSRSAYYRLWISTAWNQAWNASGIGPSIALAISTVAVVYLLAGPAGLVEQVPSWGPAIWGSGIWLIACFVLWMGKVPFELHQNELGENQLLRSQLHEARKALELYLQSQPATLADVSDLLYRLKLDMEKAKTPADFLKWVERTRPILREALVTSAADEFDQLVGCRLPDHFTEETGVDFRKTTCRSWLEHGREQVTERRINPRYRVDRAKHGSP